MMRGRSRRPALPVLSSATRNEFRRLAQLALPAVATQVGQFLFNVVDLMMVGRVSLDAVASLQLGNLWMMSSLIVAMGVVMGIDPLITQAHGAKDERRLGLALHWGVVVSLGLTVPVGLLWMATEGGLLLADQNPEHAALAGSYVLVQLPCVPAFLLFVALRHYLMGREIVAPAMWLTFLANGVNALCNWVLIYGKWGAPEMGVVGAGIATSVTRTFLLLGLIAWIVVAKHHHGAWVPWSRESLNRERLWGVIKVGVPIAIHIGLELWTFQVVMLWAGQLGTVPLASHSFVISLASFTFMIPLGISFGATTRVGNLLGAHDPVGARRASWVALFAGGAVMAAGAMVFLLFRYELPRFYSDDEPAIQLAARILPIAAAFQLFDGVQVVGTAVMRGMGRTRPAALINLVGYYGLALPAAWWLCFELGHGILGLWWGLCLGLGLVAGLVVLWIHLSGPGAEEARALRASGADSG